MTKEARMTNNERKPAALPKLVLRVSSFIRHSSFVIRHSSRPYLIGAVLVFWTLATHASMSDAQAQQPPLRPGIRSNLPPVAMRTNVRTNQAKVLPPGAPGSKTNAVAALRQPPGKAGTGIVEKVRRLPQSRGFYPALAAIFLCLGLASVLWSRFSKAKETQAGEAAPGEP